MTRQRVPNVELASDAARANLLTNGGFEIWQRGNGPFTVNNVQGADQWVNSMGVSSTYSLSKDTTNVDGGGAAAGALTYTHSSLSTIYQKVEDYRQLLGRTITLSVRVRTSTASAVRAFMTITGGAGGVTSTYQSGSGTYETLTVSSPVAAGTTQIIVGVQLNASCTAYVDNAMLVVGSVAADYAPLHPADDLARCLRYYEVVGGYVGYPSVYGSGAGATATYGVAWKVTKTVVPTITKVGTWAAINCAQPAFDRATPQGCRMYTTGTAAGAFETYPNDATGYLTVEANP